MVMIELQNMVQESTESIPPAPQQPAGVTGECQAIFEPARGLVELSCRHPEVPGAVRRALRG